MENFKEKLKVQNIIIGTGCCVLAVFFLLSAAGEAGLLPLFAPAVADSRWHSMWRGFLSGASFALLAIMLFGLVRNLRALHDDKALKKLYIRENDERAIQVWISARAAACQAFLVLGLVAIIVAGYFNVTVSLTILACVLSCSLFGLLFKFYYNRKY